MIVIIFPSTKTVINAAAGTSAVGKVMLQPRQPLIIARKPIAKSSMDENPFLYFCFYFVANNKYSKNSIFVPSIKLLTKFTIGYNFCKVIQQSINSNRKFINNLCRKKKKTKMFQSMPSYNQIDGILSGGNSRLMPDFLEKIRAGKSLLYRIIKRFGNWLSPR